jgi:acetyltransferase-like isoleucine patch superfamily enzyme
VPFLPLRSVELPFATRGLYDDWLGSIAERLVRPDCDRNALCRDVLTDLYYPGMSGRRPDDLPVGARIALAQLDPRNVTLEPEYYSDVDPQKFGRVKPLLWLWEMFDKSPAGENIHLGVRFRRILARHIFRRCGRNFKCFQFVKVSFGYNIEVGDNVVVHRCVLLDDRGGIVLGNGASVADYSNIYSHSHDLADQRIVVTPVTVIGERVRLAYHTTVLAGTRLEEGSMLGALGLATKDVPQGQLAVGIPAQVKLAKPPADKRPDLPATTDPLADADRPAGAERAAG